MATKYEDKTLPDGRVERLIFDDETPTKKTKAYTFDKANSKITMHMEKGFPFSVIELEGFERLPEPVKATGYLKNGLLSYYKSRFEGKEVKKLVVTKDGETGTSKSGKSYVVTLSYTDFKDAIDQLGKISADAKNQKTSFINNYMYAHIPEIFEFDSRYYKSVAKRIDQYLTDEVVDFLDTSAIAKVANFLKALMKARGDELSQEFDVLTATKTDIDTITLDKVIAEFEELLAKENRESVWSEFLKRNILLIESQYVRYIPEMILSTVKARKVDFGLIDSLGHIDFFEIKKPSHKVLSASDDRGNYYWSSDANKAIVQAENYAHLARVNANTIRNDLRREMDESFLLVAPKAYVVIGHTKELDSEKKRDDFIMLSRSLKNVEVMTYDILLRKLTNQRNKIVIS